MPLGRGRRLNSLSRDCKAVSTGRLLATAIVSAAVSFLFLLLPHSVNRDIINTTNTTMPNITAAVSMDSSRNLVLFGFMMQKYTLSFYCANDCHRNTNIYKNLLLLGKTNNAVINGLKAQ